MLIVEMKKKKGLKSNDLNFHFKKLGKEEQSKPREVKTKEIIINAEIIEISVENKQQKKLQKPKSCSFKSSVKLRNP